MFRNWHFLIGEIFVLLLIAALLGLAIGWLIWGRGRTEEKPAVVKQPDEALKERLATCEAECNEARTKISNLQNALDSARATASLGATGVSSVGAEAPEQAEDYDGDGVFEGENEGTKPRLLLAPREGGADNLKEIKGIGPKLEDLCHTLGVFHFDQIAAWTDDEVAWVDANLTGFKGRVSRDEWVSQAKILASGGQTEFSARVGKGDVY